MRPGLTFHCRAHRHHHDPLIVKPRTLAAFAGTSWLRVDLSRQCTDTSGAWITDYSVMIIVTVVMIVVHVIGTPATYIYLCFWKHHTALEALKEQELQDYYKGQIEKAATYRNNMKVTVTAGEVTQPQIDRKAVLPSYMLSLTGGYKHRTYWYEIFEVLRKVLLVGVPSTFADRGGEMQLFWALLVCFASFGTYMTVPCNADQTRAMRQTCGSHASNLRVSCVKLGS